MKRFILGAGFVLASLFAFQTAAYADNDKSITVADLPAAAQTLLTKHFAKYRVVLAKVENDVLDKSYDVFLANGDKVEFDRKGNWTEVVLRQDGVPAELVPAQITQYFNNAHPGAKVVKIEREARSYEVTLSNGFEYTFNKKFQVVDVDQ